jgi:hypothetical protein
MQEFEELLEPGESGLASGEAEFIDHQFVGDLAQQRDAMISHP